MGGVRPGVELEIELKGRCTRPEQNTSDQAKPTSDPLPLAYSRKASAGSGDLPAPQSVDRRASPPELVVARGPNRPTFQGYSTIYTAFAV